MQKALLILTAVFLLGCSPSAPKTEPPDRVVMNYANSTLGSLPSAVYDEARAKTFLAPELAAQFTDSSFIPLSYGIQDGPERVALGNIETQGDEATVELIGYWGKSSVVWQFTLKKPEDNWRIVDYKQ